MLVDGLSRNQLQDLAIATLRAYNTIAGPRVFSPRDWPTKPEDFPIVLLQVPQERKASDTRGRISFVSTMTLVAVGRIAHTDPSVVEDGVEKLAGQIEDALISTATFTQHVQQFTLIETQIVVTSDAKYHVGEVGVRFDIEVPQLFGPNNAVPLVSVEGTVTDQISGETLAVADISLQGA